MSLVVTLLLNIVFWCICYRAAFFVNSVHSDKLAQKVEEGSSTNAWCISPALIYYHHKIFQYADKAFQHSGDLTWLSKSDILFLARSNQLDPSFAEGVLALADDTHPKYGTYYMILGCPNLKSEKQFMAAIHTLYTMPRVTVQKDSEEITLYD